MELKINSFEKELICKGLQMLLNDKEKFKKNVFSRLNTNILSDVKDAILNDLSLTILDIDLLLNKVSNLS